MIQLKGLFKLAPALAIKYFKKKGNTYIWDWYEIWQDAHKKTFTVAKAMREDILKDIRSAVDKALTEGKTFHEFQKNSNQPCKRKVGGASKL
ncbi:MAG: hypothetical protein L6V95_15820 [Candidatus Melainabacteria bacterium]|nr:MAG: hypothetical protein L6V95_15820 [Candidatus Melainabacteria bacterium]